MQENPVMRLSSPGVLVAQSLEHPILSCHSICSVHHARGHGLHQRETPVPVSVQPCGTGLIIGWVTVREISRAVLLAGSEAGVVVINHASHLYCKCCMWAEFSVDLNRTSRVFAGYSGFLLHRSRLIRSLHPVESHDLQDYQI